MRLFIAIDLPKATKQKLIEETEILKSKVFRANFCDENNLHLTLAFLGEVDVRNVQKLYDLFNGLDFSPFNINIKGYGKFVRNDESIIYRTMDGGNALFTLRNKITSALDKLNFDYDKKPFKPHLTISRRSIIKESIEDIKPEFLNFECSSITLFSSERDNGRLIYRPLLIRHF